MDIGGTTPDLGFLVRGFPRETATAHSHRGRAHEFPDARRFFRSLSVAVLMCASDADNIVLGPDSVGFELNPPRPGFWRCGSDNDRHCRARRPSDRRRSAPGSLRSTADSSRRARPHPRPDRGCDRSNEDQQRPRARHPRGRRQYPFERSLRGHFRSPQAEQRRRCERRRPRRDLDGERSRRTRMFDFAIGREHALEQAKNEARSAALAAGAEPNSIEIVS